MTKYEADQRSLKRESEGEDGKGEEVIEESFTVGAAPRHCSDEEVITAFYFIFITDTWPRTADGTESI